MKFLPTTHLLLKQQTTLFKAIFEKKFTTRQLLELVGISVIGLALFGVVISTAVPNWWHAVTLSWKMIVLIFGSNLLCLPALYVFSSIRGSRITLLELIQAVTASVTTTAVVLLSLAPIAWFFTWSTGGDLDIIRFLNGLMVGFGILFGIILLARTFGAGYTHHKIEFPDNKSASDILVLWLILVIIVTAQMSMKLGGWYQLENQVCQSTRVVQDCFPNSATGTFIEEPTIQLNTTGGVSTAHWSIASNTCNNNGVKYTTTRRQANQQIYSSSQANCVVAGDKLNCTADLPDFDHAATGSDFELQAYNTCDDGAAYMSSVVHFTKN